MKTRKENEIWNLQCQRKYYAICFLNLYGPTHIYTYKPGMTYLHISQTMDLFSVELSIRELFFMNVINQRAIYIYVCVCFFQSEVLYTCSHTDED